jgi:hypothetical protein
VLRSGDRPGIEQELWALLTLYQLLRMAMTEAIESRPGTDPDRASFTAALETARDQLTAAAGICLSESTAQPGAIGRAVLSALLPARRPRYSSRTVKCSTSRYHEQDPSRPRASATITAISITVRTPALSTSPPRRPPSQATATHPPPAHHRHHHQPPAKRLERPRTRPDARRPTPQHAHPAPRMGPAWLLHPHRLRHLPAQHATTRRILDTSNRLGFPS